MTSSAPTAIGHVGSAVRTFLENAGEARRVTTTTKVCRGADSWELSLDHHPNWCNVLDSTGRSIFSHVAGSGPRAPADMWLEMVNHWADATLDPSTVTVSAVKSPLATKELKALALAAWCELFGVAVPAAEELKKAASARRAAKNSLVDDAIKLLRQGPAGVAEWNDQQQVLRRKVKSWPKLDLSAAKLAGLVMVGFGCPGANFAKADLTDSTLSRSRFPQANFRGAKLKHAKLQGTAFESALLEQAVFTSAEMHGVSLKKANCTGANFAKATMHFADLCGADLTDANLDGAILEKAAYDENTRWPKGFQPTLAMQWKGPGASPAAYHLAKTKKPRKPLDLKAFMKRLEGLTDAAKLGKATKMLQADRFKLYAQVTDTFLVGVVKSQTDPDLVYSCKLAGDGVYGCCTQNLNICGGLRGSLCKHLLVLIVGLANSGELDPNSVYRWILLSQGRKPVLDKDAMSETFLRYKGAEAGEVDWRPTETIPEDYYAL